MKKVFAALIMLGSLVFSIMGQECSGNAWGPTASPYVVFESCTHPSQYMVSRHCTNVDFQSTYNGGSLICDINLTYDKNGMFCTMRHTDVVFSPNGIVTITLDADALYSTTISNVRLQ